MVFLDGWLILAFAGRYLHRALSALPSRESENGDLALAPVSPSPRSPFVSGAETAWDTPRAWRLGLSVQCRSRLAAGCRRRYVIAGRLSWWRAGVSRRGSDALPSRRGWWSACCYGKDSIA